MKNLENRAKHLINKCNGDIEFAKKITFNNASLAADKGNTERLENEAAIFHFLKKDKKHNFEK